MNDLTEAVVSEIRVSTLLRQGSENIRLVFTNNRIIVDHLGKRGPGAMAGTSILGKLSGVLEDLVKGGKENLNRRTIESQRPGEILRGHKDNFAIRLEEVVSVSVEQMPSLNRITILTGDDKFEFLTQNTLDSVAETFGKKLNDRLTIHRLA